LLTGEESVSAKLFLPDVASDLIEGTLAEEGISVVEFGFDILVTPNEDSAVGYIFEANSLMEPKESDPLTVLGNKISKALPTPTADTAKK